MSPLKEPYDFLSRAHVKMTVSDAGVLVQSMNNSNGVFINEQKIKDHITTRHVGEGTVIGLGVEGPITNVPRNYPIFVLRKVVAEAEVVMLSSSDDDEDDIAAEAEVVMLSSSDDDEDDIAAEAEVILLSSDDDNMNYEI